MTGSSPVFSSIPWFRKSPLFSAAWLIALLPAPGWLLSQLPQAPPPFVRGDVLLDGALDISDPIALLTYLFRGGPRPACLDAADADDDGNLTIGDAIRTLEHLFTGGPPLPGPFPLAGGDPTLDLLACEPVPSNPGAPLPLDPAAGLEAELENPRSLPPLEFVCRGSRVALLPPELYHALEGWPAGAPLLDLAARPEWVPVIQELLDGFAGPPLLAVGRSLLAPADAHGCWKVDAELIDGGSRLLGGEGSGEERPWIRGDVNADGAVDRTDWEMAHDCFSSLGGRSEPCSEACPDAWDADDNGAVDLLDLSFLAAMVFDGLPGPEPTSCGQDPTPDRLAACQRSSCSPSRLHLRLSADPAVVCGLGVHEVWLRVEDESGGLAETLVRIFLCDPAGEDCPRLPLPTGEGSQGGPSKSSGCRWIGTQLVIPRDPVREFFQKAYTLDGKLKHERIEPPFDGLSPMAFSSKVEGPGPLHHLYAARLNANCRTPVETLERSGQGFIEVRVNLLCLEASGRKIPPPCEAGLEGEALYRSDLAIGSDLGGACAGKFAPVESLAQDETRFQVNGSQVFSKALTLQNGNQITVKSSHRFGAGAGVSPETGPAANFGVQFGISQKVVLKLGAESGFLNASSSRTANLPATLLLESLGRVRLHGEERSAAWGRVTSRAAGLWLAGRSTCQGAGDFSLKILLGRGRELEEAQERARHFFLTRLGREE